MTEEDRYRKAWKDRSRRSLIAILLMFGGFVAFVALPLIATVPQLEMLAAPYLIIMGVWVLALVASGIYAAQFRCPGCGHRFSAKQKGARYQPFCTSCGLHVGSGPDGRGISN
jgi:hypothetical protein